MDIQEFIKVMHESYYRASAYHTMKNPDNDITSGNQHVLNATYYNILDKFHAQKTIDRETAQAFIESTRDPNGWFDRAITKPEDKQGHDDNIAIIATSKALGLPYGKEIYDYGNQWRFPKLTVLGVRIPVPMKWYYENRSIDEFSISACHGRFLWLVPIYKAGAGSKLNLLDKIAYSTHLAFIVFNNDKTDTSGKILDWLSIPVMRNQSWLIDKAIGLWENEIKAMYHPDYAGEVLGIYHSPSHPYSLIMKGKI